MLGGGLIQGVYGERKEGVIVTGWLMRVKIGEERERARQEVFLDVIDIFETLSINSLFF